MVRRSGAIMKIRPNNRAAAVLLWSFLFCGGFFSVVHSDDKNPEVCARSGCVVGLSQSPEGIGRPYEAFLGLPYARPPTKRFRWQNPRPFPTWGGTTWNGTYARSECIQMNEFRDSNEITGDEDCLFLNIYRPTMRKRSLLPVVVFFHGGSFRYGSADPSTLGPEYFMETDVILVTVQYRLNIFGFLSSGDESCPGNFGLKDQAQSLRWVRRNIQSFGGDPKSVTLMGHDSGAASVHFQMMSPLSNDLFHRGIALSGTGIADWAIEVNPLKIFQQQISFSGLSKDVTSNNRMAIRELRRLDAKKLFADSLQFSKGSHRMTIFKPTTEPRSTTAFITENPKLIWKAGNFKQRPLLLSFVPVEGGWIAPLFKSQEELTKISSNLDEVLQKTLELKPENVKRVKEYYFTNETDNSTLDDAKTFLKMIGDRHFYHPLYETVHQYLNYGNTTDSPIFLMQFDYPGPFSYSKEYSESNLGIFHGDDLVYYFANPSLVPTFAKNTLDGKLSHILLQTLVNFATTDSPQMWQSVAPCHKDITTETCDYQVFQQYTKSDPKRILISVQNSYDLEMIKFWQSIIENNFQ